VHTRKLGRVFLHCSLLHLLRNPLLVFENSLPAGNDIAALFPKYLTVRKGFFIYAVVSFAINPWYLLGSASIFISFLASYQIFLSPITGVLLCHYYIIARGYLEIDAVHCEEKSNVSLHRRLELARLPCVCMCWALRRIFMDSWITCASRPQRE
jgi:cytosine/uracil/thiamine/allantoin permease